MYAIWKWCVCRCQLWFVSSESLVSNLCLMSHSCSELSAMRWPMRLLYTTPFIVNHSVGVSL